MVFDFFDTHKPQKDDKPYKPEKANNGAVAGNDLPISLAHTKTPPLPLPASLENGGQTTISPPAKVKSPDSNESSK